MVDKEPPVMFDSDIIFLMIKRLEAVGNKMMKLEYDIELDKHMARATELFDWLAHNYNTRKADEEE